MITTIAQYFSTTWGPRSLAAALAVTSFGWLTGEPSAQTPPMPTVLPSLSGVKIHVADYERTLDFYGKLLGLTAGFKFNESEWAMKWPRPEMGPMIIMVRRTGSNESAMDKANLVFMVADVRAIAARLTAQKHPIVSGPLDIPGMKVSLLFVRDPDGHMLELASAKP